MIHFWTNFAKQAPKAVQSDWLTPVTVFSHSPKAVTTHWPTKHIKQLWDGRYSELKQYGMYHQSTMEFWKGHYLWSSDIVSF